MDPIQIDSSQVYVTPSGVRVTGALLDELFQPNVNVRFKYGPEQAILLPIEDKVAMPPPE